MVIRSNGCPIEWPVDRVALCVYSDSGCPIGWLSDRVTIRPVENNNEIRPMWLSDRTAVRSAGLL
ncbi:hypothetical protein HanIR_Chr01g0008411 [Helianthus annuus]|nr:hypothetical protein HanIR_Chr01g0008411 [Helianthus annuus]